MAKLLFLLVFSWGSFASTSLIGQVRCFDKISFLENQNNEPQSSQIRRIEGEFCTYTIEHLANVSELNRKMEQALFNGQPLIYPDGVLEAFGNNDQTLIFSHTDPEIMEQMKKLIPLLDTRESFSPNDVVRIKADIYEVNELGLNNLGAGISNLRLGTGVNPNSEVANTLVSEGSGLGIDLRAGALELSGLIQAEKVKGNMKRVTQIRGDSYNLNNYSFSDITTVYQAPGAGTAISKEEEGIKLSAKVSINDVLDNTVVLKDFNFYYGVGEDRVTPDGKVTRRVNQINIPASRLILQEGVLVPILSEKFDVESTQQSTGFFNFGRDRVQESKRLLVYISVDIMTWKDYVAELNSMDTSLIQSRFSKQEKELLPTKCPSQEALLSGIKLFAVRGDDGEPVLSFGLDKSLACKNNIKKRIHVNTVGGGVKYRDNTHVVTVEELMHIPIKISGIESGYYLRPWIEFQVALNIFRDTRSMVYHKLVFARSTSYDISDSFWLE
jgi:hypothetical protein